MSESLRDQLLKSGLVRKQPANEPARPKSRPAPPRARTAPAKPPRPARPARSQEEIDLARAYALRDKSDRDARERERRETEQRAREKKERRQKLAALIEGKALNDAVADVARHFPHGDKIRRIYVTREQLPRLNTGELIVLIHNGRYVLVEREVGLAAQAIDPAVVALLCDGSDDNDDVPADLVW